MAKRKMNAKSLENLKKGKDYFANSNEIARKAQEKSVKARMERKSLKNELLLLLSVEEIQTKICNALIKRAVDGDTKAFEIIRDTIGEKPTDKLELASNEDIQKGMEKINSLLCKQKE